MCTTILFYFFKPKLNCFFFKFLFFDFKWVQFFLINNVNKILILIRYIDTYNDICYMFPSLITKTNNK